MVPYEPSDWSIHEQPRRERRRKFSAEYKARIVREAAACTKRGELGALLRKEGLYASHLASFRSAASRATKGTFATESRPTRQPSIRALSLQLARLERELARWRKRAERAEVTVRFQKKFSRSSDLRRRTSIF
jgi:transposase